METLEDEFSLFVLVLPDSVFRLEFVDLHGLTVLESGVLRVEHVGTQVQHRLLVDLGGLVL